MLYLTDFSTASKSLNFNNPIQETDRFHSVGSGITLLLSVLKGRDIETVWQKSVICCTRALRIIRGRQQILNSPKAAANFQFSIFNLQLSIFLYIFVVSK